MRASPPPHTTCESTVLPTAGLGTPGHTAAFTASGGAVRGARGRGVLETAPEGPSLAKSASRVASKHLSKATRRRQVIRFRKRSQRIWAENSQMG